MSRQFRSDDTSKWLYGFGNGSDGDLTISSNTTEAPIDSSCSGTSGASTLTATNTSFASGQIVLIHQSRGTGAGNWELNKISSYVAGTITLTHTLQNTYTDSGASQAQVRVLRQYNNVTVNSGITWTAKAWDGNVGGILGFFAKGTVTVTGTITATGKGFVGGAGSVSIGVDNAASNTGYQGESSTAIGVRSTSANGSGGSGGPQNQTGAGGGGHSSTGGAGGNSGGTSDGDSELTDFNFGGAGGGGGVDWPGGNTGGAGGNSGGIVFIVSKEIIILSSGLINTLGNNGSNKVSGSAGGGGGGAGGSTLLKGQTITLDTNRIVSTGGTGGTSTSTQAGTGSTGRIHADYSGSITGTTNPTLSSRLDSTIRNSNNSQFLTSFI